MNISQLRTFVTVVEQGSFSRAARALSVSQPAVTMQIQSLEADTGATLLDRRYRRVDLTEAGRALLPYAQRVLAEVESAREEIAALSGTLTGRLTIAASTTPGVYVIPRLLGGFLSANPQVGVTVTVHDTAEVVEAVEQGRAHLGVTGGAVKGARVLFEEVGHDELVVICPPDSPLAVAQGGSLSSLAEEMWVMRESGSATRTATERAMADAGVDPAELCVAVEFGTGEAIVSAVEGGLGVAMLSSLIASKALALGTVARVALGGDRIVRPLFTVMPRTTPARTAEEFRSYLVSSLRS